MARPGSHDVIGWVLLIRKGRNHLGWAGTLSIHEVTAHSGVSSEKHDRQDNKRQDALPFCGAGCREIPSAFVREETSRKIDNATPGGVKNVNSELQGLPPHAQSKASSGRGFVGSSAYPEQTRPR